MTCDTGTNLFFSFIYVLMTARTEIYILLDFTQIDRTNAAQLYAVFYHHRFRTSIASCYKK
ncbi:hypothetical protein MXB_4098 [Myxobolus squamalis]|nr:hypothetical protein MXB_4098 [Myxobolus squamalis]